MVSIAQKTEELFLRWMSLPETDQMVQHELSLLVAGNWQAAEAMQRQSNRLLEQTQTSTVLSPPSARSLRRRNSDEQPATVPLPLHSQAKTGQEVRGHGGWAPSRREQETVI